jgi:hypothetical protein
LRFVVGVWRSAPAGCVELNRQGAKILRAAMQKILQPQVGQRQTASPDLELLRLEEVLRLARDRLALVIRMLPDSALLRAA